MAQKKSPLTQRHIKMLEMLYEGKSTKLIADTVYFAERSIKIYQRLISEEISPVEMPLYSSQLAIINAYLDNDVTADNVSSIFSKIESTLEQLQELMQSAALLINQKPRLKNAG